MQLKCSENPSINSFAFLVLSLIISIKSASTVHMHIHVCEWKCTCVVSVPTLGTGAPLFKVSPRALNLWQRSRRDFSPLSLTPLPAAKYYQSFPGEKQRGNVIWKRGANPPQQQLLPNHNNLGKGCGLYFMGGEGPRMFIYLSPQSALTCACVCLCVCAQICVCACVCLCKFQSKMKRSIDKNHSKVQNKHGIS